MSYSTNIIFNGVDIYEEGVKLVEYAQASDWENVGVYLAKITSDLLLKSPLRNSWSFRNSEIIPFRLTNINAE